MSALTAASDLQQMPALLVNVVSQSTNIEFIAVVGADFRFGANCNILLSSSLSPSHSRSADVFLFRWQPGMVF